MASEIGYSNVYVYKKGILGWVKAGYRLDSVTDYPRVKIPRISSIQLKEMSTSSVFLLDIRPLSHFLKGHIRGSVNVDLERLHRKLDMLPKDKKIILVDHKGKLTLTTGRFLISKGFSSVSRLDGGFNAWVKNGFFAEK